MKQHKPMPNATAYRQAIREAAAAAADEPSLEFHASGIAPWQESEQQQPDDYLDFDELPF